MSDYDKYLDAVKEQIQLNNEWSAKQAQQQMDFQERMSNTAHQREMFDLQAAGLNPVLTANQGASSPSGAMAQSEGGVSAIANILSTVLDTENANARAAMYTAARGNSQNSANITGYDLNGILQLFGIRQPNSAANIQAAMLNAMANMNTEQVAKNIDEASKTFANWLGNKEPPAGSSASKAKEYKERTGNSSTGAGLDILKSLANKVISLIPSKKKGSSVSR